MARKSSASTLAPTESPESRKWRAEDDARTLQRAHEVKNDPVRMREVRAHAKRQIDALQQIHAPSGKKKA